MEPRYVRNIPALSEAECTLLRSKKVAVIGCGGLGGHLIDQMTRIGIGSIKAVDGDVFDQTNLNRQLLSEVDFIGISKAYVAGERVKHVNPDVAIEVVPEFMSEGNAAELIKGCDAVLDGLDNVKSRKILSKACFDAGIPYIFGAVSGWVAQAGISLPGDRFIETLFPDENVICEKSVLSFVPAFCASVQVSLCTKLLIGRTIESGTIYYYDLLHQEFEIIPMV